MLGIVPLHDHRGTYYLAGLEAAVEQARHGVAERSAVGSVLPPGARDPARTAGRWVGAATAPLGLQGPVSAADLSAVLSGCHPDSGRRLPGRPGTCSAYDLTFAAPKSVSVLFGVADDDVAAAVVDAHEAAVDGAVGYLEARVVAVRRGGGTGRTLLPADGVIAAAFTHGTSRALDPHLHTHAVVANRARGDDGRWSAIDGRGFFAHGAAAGALYDAHLRCELTARLGVEWDVRANGRLEVAGVDPVVIGAFSGRRAEIREALADQGRSGRRAEAVAWASTRDPKDASGAPMLDRWRQRAAGVGFDGTVLGATLQRRTSGVGHIDESRFRAALTAGGGPAVTRREVVRAWATAVRQGAPVQEIDGAVEHWAPASAGEVGVTERRHALTSMLVPDYQVQALGPRPTGAAAQPLWRAAADDIARYRARWQVVDRKPYGVDARAGAAALPLARLADHLATVRRVEDSVRRLGRDVGRDVDDRSLGHER